MLCSGDNDCGITCKVFPVSPERAEHSVPETGGFQDDWPLKMI